MHQFGHEFHLIQTCDKKEFRKARQRFLAQRAAAVQVIAARKVTFGKVLFVAIFGAGKSPGDRPNAAGSADRWIGVTLAHDLAAMRA